MTSDLDTAIFENAPVGLIYTEDRVIRRVNARFAAIFGMSVAGLTGQSLAMLYPSLDEFAHTGETWVKALSAKGDHTDERIMRRGDGTLFWCRVRGQALDPAAPLARAVWSFADLSGVRPYQPLTRREREVYSLLGEGKTSKEIARILDLSPGTVRNYLADAAQKLGAANRIEAFQIARENGWL